MGRCAGAGAGVIQSRSSGSGEETVVRGEEVATGRTDWRIEVEGLPELEVEGVRLEERYFRGG